MVGRVNRRDDEGAETEHQAGLRACGVLGALLLLGVVPGAGVAFDAAAKFAKGTTILGLPVGGVQNNVERHGFISRGATNWSRVARSSVDRRREPRRRTPVVRL